MLRRRLQRGRSGRSGRPRGAGLIEILVTLVVMSLGLLAYAAQLNRAIVSNRQAYFRSQASILASDIIERMRVNRIAADAREYNVAIGSAGSGGSLAANEVVEWKETLARELPGGDGSVAVIGVAVIGDTPKLEANIVIQWDDDGDGVPTEFRTETRL